MALHRAVDKLVHANGDQGTVVSLALYVQSLPPALAVQAWHAALGRCPPPSVLPLVYVCNDVVQRSRAKGTPYADAFEPVLPPALHLAAARAGASVAAMQRVLTIWQQRGVYAPHVVAACSQGLAAGMAGAPPPPPPSSSHMADGSDEAIGSTHGGGVDDSAAAHHRADATPFDTLALPSQPMTPSSSHAAATSSTAALIEQLQQHQRRWVVAQAAKSLVDRIQPDILNGTLPLPDMKGEGGDDGVGLTQLDAVAAELHTAEKLVRNYVAALQGLVDSRSGVVQSLQDTLEQQQAALFAAVDTSSTLDTAVATAATIAAAAAAGKTIRHPAGASASGHAAGAAAAGVAAGGGGSLAVNGGGGGGVAGQSVVDDEYAALMSDDWASLGLTTTAEAADAAAVDVFHSLPPPIPLQPATSAAHVHAGSMGTGGGGGGSHASLPAPALGTKRTRPTAPIPSSGPGAGGGGVGKRRRPGELVSVSDLMAEEEAAVSSEEEEEEAEEAEVEGGADNGMGGGGEVEVEDAYAAPKGKRWDPLRGMFVPVSEEFSANTDESWREH